MFWVRFQVSFHQKIRFEIPKRLLVYLRWKTSAITNLKQRINCAVVNNPSSTVLHKFSHQRLSSSPFFTFNGSRRTKTKLPVFSRDFNPQFPSHPAVKRIPQLKLLESKDGAQSARSAAGPGGTDGCATCYKEVMIPEAVVMVEHDTAAATATAIQIAPLYFIILYLLQILTSVC